MVKPKKWGSPYDPNNKLPHPKAKTSEEQMTTPDDKSMLSLFLQQQESIFKLSKSDIMDEYRFFKIIDNHAQSPGPDGQVSSQTTRAHPAATFSPPRSYVAAREKVAQWLQKAPEQAFADIVGNDEALTALRDAVTGPVLHAELYKQYGMKAPKGALLYGAPGCGKTMFARAAASEMRSLYKGDVEFICLAGSEIQSYWAGHTEERIRSLFKFAAEYKAYHGHPLLIFIDEAEAILPSRDNAYSYKQDNVSTFLACMDGVVESSAFVLLATNRPEALDEALLRDGRCDFKVPVKRPNYEAAATILGRAFSKAAPDRFPATLAEVALESIFDPNKVLIDGKVFWANLKERTLTEGPLRPFLLEHIVSGAMLVSVPERAKRAAFARDKSTGTFTGVGVADVHKAVNDLYEENKGLCHHFALQEFRENVLREMEELHEKK